MSGQDDRPGGPIAAVTILTGILDTWSSTRLGANVDILVRVVEAGGRRRDAEVVRILQAALRQRDADVRRAAVEALGALGDPGAAEALRRALSDQAGSVRQEAAIALKRL